MEDKQLGHKPLLVSLLVVVFIWILKKCWLMTRPTATRPRLPPGPWKLPVIGSMHHLMTNVPPHRALRDLAGAHGPIMMLQLGETRLVVVSSREVARQVLRTHDANFATRPRLLSSEILLYGCVDILFSPSGEYWRKLRQLCAAEVLSPKRVSSFRHIREQEMASQVERVRSAGPSTPVDLSAMFLDLAISIVARASFGKKLGNAADYLAALNTAVAQATGFKIPDLFPTWRPVLAAVTGMRRTLLDAHSTLDSTLEKIIAERKGATKDDEENLVDVLIGLQERGGLGFNLKRNSVKAVVLNMFAAGTRTIASTLGWGMSELIRNERVMAKLQAEVREAFRGTAVVTEAEITAASSSSLPYLKLVVKETLRLHPPLPLLVPRESIDECEVGGYTIPARSRVVVNVWAIGRDERYWGDDADEFKPERFEDGAIDFMGSSYEYLPFGAGRRMCPGIAYGLVALEVALVQLLYHFDWSLPEGAGEVDMTEAPGLGVHRKSPLLLCATPLIPENN